MLLGKDNKMRLVDLGLVHFSAADSTVTLMMNRLRQDGDVEAGVSPNFLVRNWPPAFKEWATKSVRDAFFASPQFPRLLNGEVVRDTIVRGVCEGILAYVGKTASGDYDPLLFRKTVTLDDVELSEDVYIVTKETAEAYLKSKAKPQVVVPGPETPTPPKPGETITPVTPAGQTGQTGGTRHGLSAGDRAKRHGGETDVDRGRSFAKVDELLHQGALEVRRRQGTHIDRHRGGRTRWGHLHSESRGNEGSAAGIGARGRRRNHLGEIDRPWQLEFPDSFLESFKSSDRKNIQDPSSLCTAPQRRKLRKNRSPTRPWMPGGKSSTETSVRIAINER